MGISADKMAFLLITFSSFHSELASFISTPSPSVLLSSSTLTLWERSWGQGRLVQGRFGDVNVESESCFSIFLAGVVCCTNLNWTQQIFTIGKQLVSEMRELESWGGGGKRKNGEGEINRDEREREWVCKIWNNLLKKWSRECEKEKEIEIECDLIERSCK